MSEQECLKQIQKHWKCEHVRVLGEPCDADNGGWSTCICAVAAWKKNGEEKQCSVDKRAQFRANQAR